MLKNLSFGWDMVKNPIEIAIWAKGHMPPRTRHTLLSGWHAPHGKRNAPIRVSLSILRRALISKWRTLLQPLCFNRMFFMNFSFYFHPFFCAFFCFTSYYWLMSLLCVASSLTFFLRQPYGGPQMVEETYSLDLIHGGIGRFQAIRGVTTYWNYQEDLPLLLGWEMVGHHSHFPHS